MRIERKAVLIVIDGWGIAQEKKGNAIACARTPHYTRFLSEYPSSQLEASGLCVGLPDGVMGNSEVGHMNIGAGRKVMQDQVRINDALDSGSFFQNDILKGAMEKVRLQKRRLHLVGLISQGNVHSCERHYLSLIKMARQEGIADQLFVHAILDGRDTPPKSAATYLATLEAALAKEGGKVATLSGRFYSMDRDQRWERIEKSYQAMVFGQGLKQQHSSVALTAAYARGETDEFVSPTVLVDDQQNPLGQIQPDDTILFFNFRPDRMRQIVATLAKRDTPVPSIQKDLLVSAICFTRYDKTFDLPYVFPPQDLTLCLGEWISINKRLQFRTAETEKYAHVTYFFNGGRELPFEGEERQMIASPKVKTYDLSPEMSSVAVTELVVSRVGQEKDQLIVVNFAQPDMVGHTGNFDAAVCAVESADRALGEIVEAGFDHHFLTLITADHGNVEKMMDPLTGQPHTAHTLNPVPLICLGDSMKGRELGDGALCDVAPTLLSALEMEIPSQMTGKNLLR